ncbi:MAG: tRNA (adenosine(37)-N6)-dimethylallyltransferase MiaA [Verrucomicrobia bacterium]|nr:MAG: tRNA (adenosine(37)-N6)-dimethylallyltransferase MiaA [Verrucomicrobiota bacterium]
MKKKLYFLTGPTASGKTALGIEWAKKNDAEILSCDSLLFYKGMDIGTAKPSPEEREGVRHYGIDMGSVDKPFNVKNYIDFSKQVVDEVYARGKKLLVLGGSGFYLKSFFAPVVDDLEISETISNHVLSLYEEQGLEGIVNELLKINPESVGDLDLHNPRRVQKALMRCLGTGKNLFELKDSFDNQKEPFSDFEKKICILDRDNPFLYERIRRRVFHMLDCDLISEVKELLKQGIEKNPSAASAIGYRETIRWLKSGHENRDDLAEAIILSTNQLVAKQRKWFRTQIKNAKIINLEDPGLNFDFD